MDNGPEFAGRMLDQRAYLNKVELDFSKPGKPTDNGFIEAFNARLGSECLNASWFLSMAALGSGSRPGGRTTTTTVRTRASRNLTPAEFVDQLTRALELS